MVTNGFPIMFLFNIMAFFDMNSKDFVRCIEFARNIVLFQGTIYMLRGFR